MKKKIVQGSENLKKMEMLTQKLGNYFKNRYASLMEEHNYTYSQLILDLGSFWRTMKGFGIETESIVPKVEKYLMDKLLKTKVENIRYDTDINIDIPKNDGNITTKNSTRKLNLQNINNSKTFKNLKKTLNLPKKLRKRKRQ